MSAGLIIFFLRIPTTVDVRNRWIEVIESHQQYDYEAQYFNMCELHFERDRIIPNGIGKFTLKKGTLPSIFPEKKRFVQCTLFSW